MVFEIDTLGYLCGGSNLAEKAGLVNYSSGLANCPADKSRD